MNFAQAHNDYLDPDRQNGKNQIAEIDVDEDYSVAIDNDVIYFAVAKNKKGWWMSAMVDSETGHFVCDLVVDSGPFDSEERALLAGLDCAVEWLLNNNFPSLGRINIDSRLNHLKHQ